MCIRNCFSVVQHYYNLYLVKYVGSVLAFLRNCYVECIPGVGM